MIVTYLKQIRKMCNFKYNTIHIKSLLHLKTACVKVFNAASAELYKQNHIFLLFSGFTISLLNYNWKKCLHLCTIIHLVCDAPTYLEDMPESHAQTQVWLC